MALSLHVTFRHMSHSDALDTYVRAKADKIDTLHRKISSCHVVLEAPRHHQTRRYRVRIELTVPGSELVVSHAHGQAGEDAYAAVDEAFHDAARMLVEHASKRRAARGERTLE